MRIILKKELNWFPSKKNKPSNRDKFKENKDTDNPKKKPESLKMLTQEWKDQLQFKLDMIDKAWKSKLKECLSEN